MFFGEVLHSNCPEFYDYNQEKFASYLGDRGCLFKLGCLGIRTKADCPTRRWNNKVNWCIEAGAPCIGCTSPDFAQKSDFPFYRLREF
jgi:hydrogenase small subunit